jgi:hypothetical protein
MSIRISGTIGTRRFHPNAAEPQQSGVTWTNSNSNLKIQTSSKVLMTESRFPFAKIGIGFLDFGFV